MIGFIAERMIYIMLIVMIIGWLYVVAERLIWLFTAPDKKETLYEDD